MKPIVLLYFALFWLPLFGLVAFSAWRGGGPERLAVLTLLLGGVLSWLAVRPDAQSFTQLERGLAAVDGVVLVVFLFLALFAHRWWPRCIAGFQLVSVLAHVAKLLDLGIAAGAYSQMESMMSWPMLVTIATGTCLHVRRTRLTGAEPSWSRSLLPAARRTLERLRMG